MALKGEVNLSKETIEVYIHPIYLKILQQIEQGNKTSTSISNELNMAQSGIYERLKKMKKIGLLKSDEKNFIIEYNFLFISILATLPKSFIESFENKYNLEKKVVELIKKGLLENKKNSYNISFFLTHIVQTAL